MIQLTSLSTIKYPDAIHVLELKLFAAGRTNHCSAVVVPKRLSPRADIFTAPILKILAPCSPLTSKPVCITLGLCVVVIDNKMDGLYDMYAEPNMAGDAIRELQGFEKHAYVNPTTLIAIAGHARPNWTAINIFLL
jgi:hypothetical protein